MESLAFLFLALSAFSCTSHAAPTPAETGDALVKRDDYSSILSSLTPIRATATPTSPSQAIKSLSSIFEASPTQATLYDAVAEIIQDGLCADSVADLLGFVDGSLTGDNSEANVNLKNPTPKAYPKAGTSDAPYDLTEAQLRAAIHIPSTFKYGAGAQPIILVPGTGDTGYTTFDGNYIQLLTGSSIGDPVWLNIPRYLLNDAQTNSEYVAYAVNYIFGISNRRKLAIFAWSQGNINTQWAFKYWPSTRSKVTDHVAFSPDYHGTTLANLVAAPGEPLPPSSSYSMLVTFGKLC